MRQRRTHDVNDNHAKDDIESALDYISDAKCGFVKELKYQFSNLEYLEPEIIDFCTRYDVCRDTVKVIAAGYDCVEVTSKMYLNVRLARAGYVPENHAFIALEANGNVSCVQPLEFIIDVHCTSESDKEFTRGYVREALIKLISEAVASSILDGVEVGNVSELNVTIVNK